MVVKYYHLPSWSKLNKSDIIGILSTVYYLDKFLNGLKMEREVIANDYTSEKHANIEEVYKMI